MFSCEEPNSKHRARNAPLYRLRTVIWVWPPWLLVALTAAIYPSQPFVSNVGGHRHAPGGKRGVHTDTASPFSERLDPHTWLSRQRAGHPHHGASVRRQRRDVCGRGPSIGLQVEGGVTAGDREVPAAPYVDVVRLATRHLVVRNQSRGLEALGLDGAEGYML